jgi:hypothetical protein
MAEDTGYRAIIDAVHGRWRRRFFTITHLLIATILLSQVWQIYYEAYTYTDMNGVTQQGYMELWTYGIEHPIGIGWACIVMLHLVYALFAEVRDRAVRREVERERKWRLLERMEVSDPIWQHRARRLASPKDGELLDFDITAWEANAKQKRGSS